MCESGSLRNPEKMFLQSNNHFFLPALSGCPVYWFLIQSWRMSSGTCWWRQKSSGFSTKGAHINSWWKCKLVQDFWRDSGSLYQETEKKIIPFHPVSLFLGIQLIDIIRDLVRNQCPKIITKSWKLLKCSRILVKLWCIHMDGLEIIH